MPKESCFWQMPVELPLEKGLLYLSSLSNNFPLSYMKALLVMTISIELS